MKRRRHILGVIAGLVVTALFVLYVVHALHGHDLSVYVTPRAFGSIVCAALLWTASLPLNALAWRGMLAGLGAHKSWRELTAILGITQFAKYLPGNVAQYIGRAGMSLSRGIPARALAVSIVLEILLVVAAALVVGVGAGVWSVVGLALVRHKGEQLTLVIALLVAIVTTLWIFRRFAPILLRRFAPQHVHLLDGNLLPPPTTMLRAFVLYAVVYGFLGLGLVVLAHLLLPHSAHDNCLLVASFALAWVVGFVTPGAPAGLGVREGLLLLMLAPAYSPAAASILVIALRLATTLGDVLGLAGGLLLLPRLPLASETQSPC